MGTMCYALVFNYYTRGQKQQIKR